MNRWTFIAGIGVGATAMYFLEPSAGRRRAMLRDKSVWAVKKGARFSARGSRDLANRTKGAVLEIAGRVSERRPSDEVLGERVRSRLGRIVSNPGAIEAVSSEGRITLRGTVLKAELDRLLRGVAGVRGVHSVTNELDVQETGADVPGLREGRHWPLVGRMPRATRLLTGIAAGTAAVLAMTRRVA
jgi:hypothetical protein